MSMELFFSNFYAAIAAFSDSVVFLVVKILLGIYVAVLLVDIILLLIQRGFSKIFREGFTIGMNVPSELTIKKKKTKFRWGAIKKRLENQKEEEFKVAIIEADEMIGGLLEGLGYQGENLGEILKNISEMQVESIAKIRKAHEIKNRIIHDENFPVSLELARETLGYFEEFLDEFEVFD